MKSNGTLLPAERQQRILEILREEYTIRGTRLSELLNVSEMTIRRDLDLLEQQGLVERTHGGAVFRQERVAGKFHYQSAIKENPKEKEMVARRAAELIAPNDTIFIGEGTTAARIARHIDPQMPLTIVTNNLGVVAEVKSEAAELILLGGVYDPATHSMSGSLAMEMIRRINANKVILGADGLSLKAGLTTPNLDIAVIERQMIEQTHGQVIVMADHPKFGLIAEMSVVPIRQIDVLITNRNVPGDVTRDLGKIGVQVIIT